jgi:hypothetical protein
MDILLKKPIHRPVQTEQGITEHFTVLVKRWSNSKDHDHDHELLFPPLSEASTTTLREMCEAYATVHGIPYPPNDIENIWERATCSEEETAMLFYLALDIITGNCSIIQLKALVHTGKNSSSVSHLYVFLVELLLMFGIQHSTRSFPFNEYNVSCCLALLMRNNKKQWVDNQEIRRSFILWTCLGAIRQPKLFVLPLTEIVNHTNDVSDTCFIPIYCRVASAKFLNYTYYIYAYISDTSYTICLKSFHYN